MPHSRSSRKRVRQNETRRQSNLVVRGAMRSQEKRVKELIAAGKLDEARTELALAYKRLDKAAKVHVVHANTAANHKRKLALALAKASAKKS
jgi:small subunit ribosomal protein S20